MIMPKNTKRTKVFDNETKKIFDDEFIDELKAIEEEYGMRMSNNRKAIIEIQDVCRFLNCDVYSLWERVQIKPNLLSKHANEWLKHNINELIRLKNKRHDNK